jgi:DNA sulfur modification protein DndD
MIIKEVELYNFRLYKGRNIVDLRPDDGKNIFVISGWNGFGKTTFLMSLVWCMYGKQMQEVDDLYYKEISDQGGYSKYISNSLNKMARNEGETHFHVSITFQDVNIPDLECREIKITRSFDIVGSTTDEVQILIDGYPNELTKDVGPEYFIRDFLLPKEIAKFFFFDAEKIVALAEINSAEQRKSLSLAYSEVLGIKKYEELKKQLEDIQLKLRQESATSSEKAKLIQLEAEVKVNEGKNEDRNQDITEYREKILEKRKEASEIQEKLIRAGSVITIEELMAFRAQEEELDNKLNDLQSELKDQFEIIPFAIAGDKFLEVSKQLENESNYRLLKFKQENYKDITEKILTDLLNEPRPTDVIIDHRTYDHFSRVFEKLIRKHFFGDIEDIPEVLKIIHEFSDLEKNEMNALLNSIKNSFGEAFKRINGDVLQTRNDLNLIRRKIRDAESNQEDPIIAELRKKKDSLFSEIHGLEESINQKNIEIGESNTIITQHRKTILEISNKLKVSEKNKEKDELTARMIARLREYISNFKEEKKKSLEQTILEGLKTLMHKDLIRKVVVEIISEDIEILLYDENGEEIKKEALSKGEQQLYATALLKGLIEESNIDFPVFIDSPMQKFDEQHAENIVRYFYPNVSSQVTIFPLLHKEMNEQEYNLLLPYVSSSFLIKNIKDTRSEFVPVSPVDLFKIYQILKNAN